MYRSDLYSVDELAPSASRRRLPVHVEPGRDEALWPWLCRLGNIIGLSPLSTVHLCFGIDSWGDPEWWRHPGEGRLTTISERTGLALERVRAMTFDGWGIALDDETAGRFSAERVRRGPRRMHHERPITICPQCLAEDPEPYLRRLWLVGWTAVCPRHRSVLARKCPWCFASLRLPCLRANNRVEIGRCHRCGDSLAGVAVEPAHDTVLVWQNRLLALKRHGSGIAGGLGRIGWATLIANIDVLISVVWGEAEEAARERFFDRVANDLGFDGMQRHITAWSENYGTLLILAWIFDGWPDRLGRAMMLLKAPPLDELVDRRADIESAPHQRLGCVLAAPRVRPADEQPAWRTWLDELDESGQALRDRVLTERGHGARKRLNVLAALRDGASIEAASATARVRPPKAYRWLRYGSHYGLEALLAPPPSGLPLTRAQTEEIGQWIASVRRPRHGRSAWRIEHVQTEAIRRFNAAISRDCAEQLLRRQRRTLESTAGGNGADGLSARTVTGTAESPL